MTAEQKTIQAHLSPSQFQLDGDAAKWRGAPSIRFSASVLGGRQRQTEVFALWDERNLYLRFDVHGPRIRASVRERDGDKLWEDDGVEFLIDARLDRSKEFLPDDFAYHINILNAVYDDRGTPAGQPDEKWNGKAEHVVKIFDSFHYAVEVAVPWEEIGLEPQAGKTAIGIDFCVNGKDPLTQNYVYYDWCGRKVFHDPSGFGELILADARP